MEENGLSVGAGWAWATTRDLLSRSLLYGVAVMTFVVGVSILLTSATHGDRWWLLPLHGLVAATAVGAARGRVPVSFVTVGVIGLIPLDWWVDGPDETLLTLAVIWLMHLTQLVPTALDRHPSARFQSVALAFGVPVVLAIIRPDWIWHIAIPLGVAGLAVRWAGMHVVPAFDDFTAGIDADLEESWSAQHRLTAAQAAARELSEQARTLHDTAVNTLAAVASGGAATADVELVRIRCQRDVTRLEALLEGIDASPDLRLDPIATEVGVVLEREGLTDDELARVAAGLPDDVVRAIAGAVREAILNVAKHAGTGRATAFARQEASRLVVRVRDDGAGFDGELVAGRGLAESVVGRAAAAGATATVRSRPGGGTEVEIVYDLLGPEAGAPSGRPAPNRLHASTDVDRVLHRACWLWCAATAVIGPVIELVRPDLNPTYGMLALTILVTIVTLRAVRDGQPLSHPLSALAALSVPVAFVLAAGRGDWGRNDPTAWQCIGCATPLVILVVHARVRTYFIGAVAGLIVAATVVTIVLYQDSPEAAAFIPIGAIPPLGLAIGWSRFRSLLDELGREASTQYELAQLARAERIAQEEAAAVHARWRAAGVTSSLGLLRALAEGLAHPGHPATSERCRQEEAFLRQLCQLDPGLFRLGGHLARALADARTGAVRLDVRTGDRDVDDAAAARLGTLLRAAVAAAAPGDDLVVTLFVAGKSLQFTVVGPAGVVDRAAGSWSPPPGWTSSTSTFGGQAIVEVTQATPVGWTLAPV